MQATIISIYTNKILELIEVTENTESYVYSKYNCVYNVETTATSITYYVYQR